VSASHKPKLAVWKFASCDGCQLTLLDLEDELLALAGAVELAEFREATSSVVEGPYDLSLVEGSITTQHDAERIQEVRRASKALVTIGACATSGGIQALRNFADVDEFVRTVYASPGYISTLETSTPIAAHISVDFELRGCPIDKRQLLEVVTAFLHGRKPGIPSTSVCTDCQRRGLVCVTVAHGTPLATMMHTLPRILHSTHVAWLATLGRRPCRYAEITSSSWRLSIGQPRSSKSTLTWDEIGVEVASVAM
jgi:sulfhydrogenase subunit delta